MSDDDDGVGKTVDTKRLRSAFQAWSKFTAARKKLQEVTRHPQIRRKYWMHWKRAARAQAQRNKAMIENDCNLLREQQHLRQRQREFRRLMRETFRVWKQAALGDKFRRHQLVTRAWKSWRWRVTEGHMKIAVDWYAQTRLCRTVFLHWALIAQHKSYWRLHTNTSEKWGREILLRRAWLRWKERYASTVRDDSGWDAPPVDEKEGSRRGRDWLLRQILREWQSQAVAAAAAATPPRLGRRQGHPYVCEWEAAAKVPPEDPLQEIHKKNFGATFHPCSNRRGSGGVSGYQ